MACNPPYARGLTGKWDKCRFPGVLRQDCYQYINFDYNCSKLPECISVSGVDIVFYACHGCDLAEYDFYFGGLGTEGKWDDNKQKSLGNINLNSGVPGANKGAISPNKVTSIPDKYSCSNSKTTINGTTCCIPVCSNILSIQSMEIPSSMFDNIDFSSIDQNCIEVFVKLKCALPSDLKCHSDVTKYIAYSKKDGCCVATGSLNSASDIGYGLGVEKIKICCNSCCGPSTNGSFNSGLGSCERIDNVSKVTNNFKTKALLEVTGGANDEVIIDGNIYQAGEFPFNWSSFNTGCSVDGDNGGHAWSYSKILQPNESVTFGGKDNGYGGEVNGSWTLKTCTDSSSGSSGVCNITAQLKTTGCCLELEESTGRMYAVGSGTVSASIIRGFCSKCSDFSIYINEQKNSAVVRDGSTIIVSGRSTKCKCSRKTPWRTPGGFKPGPCHKGPAPTPGPYRILKNTETGVYQIELNLNTLGQKDCGCG